MDIIDAERPIPFRSVLPEDLVLWLLQLAKIPLAEHPRHHTCPASPEKWLVELEHFYQSYKSRTIVCQ